MFIELSSGAATARISDLGAELKSLKVNKTEYIWQGDNRFWSDSAPVLFPICSGLKDGEYSYAGKTYKLPKHGFARYKTFTVEQKNESCATFLLKSDDETLAVYPFCYELRITYTLTGSKLTVKYEIKNCSETFMYFSIGAHEGYNLPLGLQNYEIEFSQNETLYTCLIDGDTLSGKRKLILDNSNTLPLKYDYFSEDALIFKDLKSNSAIIKSRQTDKSIKVSFDGFDYFLLWTVPGANFICLEPWCGITDNYDHNKDIKTKEGINALAPGKVFVRAHSLEII